MANVYRETVRKLISNLPSVAHVEMEKNDKEVAPVTAAAWTRNQNQCEDDRPDISTSWRISKLGTIRATIPGMGPAYRRHGKNITV